MQFITYRATLNCGENRLQQFQVRQYTMFVALFMTYDMNTRRRAMPFLLFACIITARNNELKDSG